MSLLTEITDPDAALSLLAGQRGAVRIHSRREPPAIRLVHGNLGPAGLDRMSLGMDLDIDVAAQGPFVFGQVISGTVGFRADGTERWYAPGEVYLASQPGHERTTMIRSGEHEQAVIDPALVSRIAQTAPGRAPGPVRFTGYAPSGGQAAALWKSTCAYVRNTVISSPDAAGYPLLATSAARLLAATALAVFPNDALTEPTVTDRHDGSPATVRLATAFVDEHAHEDITTTDIAAAAYVSVRAVQLAFRRHLDCTPMAYLRRVRLDHAHRQLTAADPVSESVTAVAYRWGFPSPSRFAACYRQAYGVLPSYSLHN